MSAAWLRAVGRCVMSAKRNKKHESTDESLIMAVLQENEKRANKLAVYIFCAGLIIVLLNAALNELGFFKLGDRSEKWITYVFAALSCIIPILAYISGAFPQRVLKWINLTGITLVAVWADLTTNYNSVLLTVAPIMMASLYFSKKTTVITYISSMIAFGCSSFIGSFKLSLLDNNHVAVPDGTVLTVHGTLKQTLVEYGFRNAEYTEKMMLLGYLPRLLVSVILFVIAIAITEYGFDMLIRQAKQTADITRLSTELKFAGDLQANALPPLSSVNGKYNFELAASMTAAKEAGGDFYDFMMIDETHLALVIADVSGKGVPAAMFMMSAKEKLRSAFAPGRTPGEILYAVNNSLSENNKKLMFVTVWLGILDIASGRLVSANGGHEDPLLKRGSGCFTRISEKHGIALGVRRDMKFPEQELQLGSGDIVLQYTDGITEARNSGDEMYGRQRLLDGLNAAFDGRALTADELNTGLRKQVADFVGKADPADDITTLVLRYQ